MKTRLLLIIFSIVGFVTIAHAQKASQGKAVVSHGFENSDSVRFGMLRPYDVGYWMFDNYLEVDTLMDPLGCSAEEDFDEPVKGEKSFYGHRKVICAQGVLKDGYYGAPETGPDLYQFGENVRQRLYLAHPVLNDPKFEYWFRYNDSTFNPNAVFHNNTYDTNDISPYMEYPANPGFVDSTFMTTRFNTGTDSTLHSAYYGNEGRIILGYNDSRLADYLLKTTNQYPFPSSPLHPDTAKRVSVTLEFQADTTTINMSNAANPTDTDDAPLVRLQVLYKPAGQSVLPFVPFTDAAHPTNPGWFKCLDTVITRAVYRTLPDDWRSEDSVVNSSEVEGIAHPWHFKQLHAMISENAAMQALNSIDPHNPTDTNYDGGNFNSSPITTWVHPDSLVFYGTVGPDKYSHLLEIRVLSTYRSTVRVRNVAFQDTMVDRYLNRRGFGDSTHSVEENGAIGGNDKLMDSTLHSWYTLLWPNLPREIMYNDEGLWTMGFPAMGYLDYMGAKYNIYVHMRPQDDGDMSLPFRIARMSLDGQPPSIFENQEGNYGRSAFSNSESESLGALGTNSK